MDTRIDLDLLDRYLAGACTARERADVDRWLAADPRRSVVTLKTRTSGGYPLVIDDSRTIWTRVVQRIHLEPGTSIQARQSARWETSEGQPLRRWVWYMLAGVAMATIVIVAGQHAGRLHGSGYRAPALSTYATGNGERANVTLPDGNTVSLDVASRLDVPADYLMGDHTLQLTGGALFTVRHHGGVPFTVIAGPTTTHVLG
ncbi:MAG TPA: FecR family protein, partial [Gemmatimonadaceae bacterium]|nr:FecR family protein [Gemmatimonadaceae bacterium]